MACHQVLWSIFEDDIQTQYNMLSETPTSMNILAHTGPVLRDEHACIISVPSEGLI